MTVNRVAQGIGYFAVVVAMGLTAWLLVVLVRAFSSIATSDSQTAKAVAIACVTGAFGIVSLLIERHLTRRSAVEQETRLKKIPIYEKFVTAYFEGLHQAGKPAPDLSDQMIQGLKVVNAQLMVWAPDDVVRALVAFRTASEGAGGGLRSAIEFESVLFAIRKDLGHDNRLMRRGDLLRVFINDLDSVLTGDGPARSGADP